MSHHHAHPIADADHALTERKSLTAKALSAIVAAAFFGAAVYALFFGEEPYYIAAGIFFFVGAAILAYTVSGIRLGPDNKLRRALLDHPGMRPEERYESKREREREADEDVPREDMPR